MWGEWWPTVFPPRTHCCRSEFISFWSRRSNLVTQILILLSSAFKKTCLTLQQNIFKKLQKSLKNLFWKFWHFNVNLTRLFAFYFWYLFVLFTHLLSNTSRSSSSSSCSMASTAALLHRQQVSPSTTPGDTQ